MTNADPAELTFEIDALTRRITGLIVKMREAAVYAPTEIPEAEPHRWPRVLRRWQAKHR